MKDQNQNKSILSLSAPLKGDLFIVKENVHIKTNGYSIHVNNLDLSDASQSAIYHNETALLNKIEELQAKLNEAVKVLEFYADEKHWGESLPDIRDWYLVETTDRGKKARQVLRKIRGEE